MLVVEGVVLDAFEELQGIVECLAVARGASIFREAVDGKADGIELLLGIEGIAFVVDAPIDTAVFVVDEMVDEVILGARGGG